MKKPNDVAVLTSAGLLAVIGVAIFDDVTRSAPPAADAIVGSFERDISRLPGPTPPATRDAIDNDVLYRTVNPVHWTDDSGAEYEVSDEEGSDDER
ncbi:MAG: hypothetical protein QNJ14_03695 [Woeseiaceae bacterium]|nr:hypothetical protein [Woeseiaceae bacterium]